MLSFCTVIYSSRYVCYKNKDSYYKVRCFIAVIQGDVMSLFYWQQCLLTKRTGTLQRTVYSYVCSMVVEITQAHTHCCSSSHVCLYVCVCVCVSKVNTNNRPALLHSDFLPGVGVNWRSSFQKRNTFVLSLRDALQQLYRAYSHRTSLHM